jgi:autophagy-related protein 9
MDGNLFSRFVPGKDDGAFYEQLQDDHDIDIENRAGLALDDENLAHQFHDDDLQTAAGFGIDDSRMSVGSAINPSRNGRRGQARRGRQESGTRWLAADDDGDNEVPASLLVEPGVALAAAPSTSPQSGPRPSTRTAIPGPSSRRTQAQWETAQAQQRLHRDDDYTRAAGGARAGPPTRRLGLASNPKEKAMFRWANVSNLDAFTNEVYDYYLGAGFWCIILDNVLHIVYVLRGRARASDHMLT